MIHKYKLNGLNIVLDVHSGGVHLVDELTYDMLDNVSPPFEKECPERSWRSFRFSTSPRILPPATAR